MLVNNMPTMLDLVVGFTPEVAGMLAAHGVTHGLGVARVVILPPGEARFGVIIGNGDATTLIACGLGIGMSALASVGVAMPCVCVCVRARRRRHIPAA